MNWGESSQGFSPFFYSPLVYQKSLKTMLIDPRLESDSTFILDLDLCQVRLHHNAAFPWILLIPKIEGISEIIDLTPADQQQLMAEIVQASKIMKHLFNPIKLNVANLGNVVPQLHVHIIARYETDAAWPGPVWGRGIEGGYEPIRLAEAISMIRAEFLVRGD